MPDQSNEAGVVVTVDGKRELLATDSPATPTYRDRVGGDPIPTAISGRTILIALVVFGAISAVIGYLVLRGTNNEQLLENRLRIGDVLVVNDIVDEGPNKLEHYLAGLDDDSRDYRNGCRGVLLGWWDTLTTDQRREVADGALDVRLQRAGGNPSAGTIAFRLNAMPPAVTVEPSLTLHLDDREIAVALPKEWQPRTMVQTHDMVLLWRDVESADTRLIGKVLLGAGIYRVSFSGTAVVGSGDARTKLPWVTDPLDIEIPAD